MNPFRTMQTAGFLKSLLDLLFWAIILLAPVYVVLVMLGYQRPGGADVFLAADVRFEPSPGDWAPAGRSCAGTPAGCAASA